MRVAILNLACVLAAGCAAPSLPTLPGTPTAVHILDAGFVKFEGERIPREAFLYEMRRRVRSAGGEAGQRPAVRILLDAEDQGELDSLLLELERAGVKSVTLG